jgi:hypothetical protein
VLKHPPFASTETSQSTYGIDCFPFLDTNQADDDKRLRGIILKVARKPLSKSDLATIALRPSHDVRKTP